MGGQAISYDFGSGGSNLTLEAGLLNDPDNRQIAHFDYTVGPLYPERED
jgi:hypothetical protein